MSTAIDTWQCPNCGKVNQTAMLDKRVCERCGWSDEEPEDDPPWYQ